MFVFAYGTLVLPEIRDRVLGHPVETTEAILHGHSKVCGWDYLTLVPSDSSVRGVLFEADERDVKRMDVWEDVPMYELVPVSVETADGVVEAFAYIMPEPPEHYETVGDGCIAAIPIREIMDELDRLMNGRRHRCPAIPFPDVHENTHHIDLFRYLRSEACIIAWINEASAGPTSPGEFTETDITPSSSETPF